MIITLEKHKITEEVKHKLIGKGLSLIGMSDKDIIFRKLRPGLLLNGLALGAKSF